MVSRAPVVSSCVALLAVGAFGCGDGDETVPPPPGGEPPACEAPEVALPDGSCIRPGVAPDGCGEGFVHDGSYGCEPILPAEPCPYGMMAVPGEAECRPVMDCGEGRWGELPVDAATVYVDASYAGGGSDGTDARPFTTIGAAVAAAAPGALIAVAEGRYEEDVVIEGKPLRLWGRCPDMVEVVGTSNGWVALMIHTYASGTEVGGLAIGGPVFGVFVTGSEDVSLERLWVRESGVCGIDVDGVDGVTSARVAGALVEKNHDFGLLVEGSQVTIEGTVVRATLPSASDQNGGRGISIQLACTNGVCDPARRSVATVRGSLVEQNHDVGLFVEGSEATIESTVVRATLPRGSDQGGGRGISIQPWCGQTKCDPTTRSVATVRGSLVEDSHDVGLLVTGSEATIESTVVRATLPQASHQSAGTGILVQLPCSQAGCDPTARSVATVRGSLVEQSHYLGLLVLGSEATIESTVVRATLARASDGLFGDGIAVVSHGAVASAALSTLLVDDSARAGVASFGATVSLSSTQLRCAAFALDGEHYDGRDYAFEDGGNNTCGCPAADGPCKVVSSGLEPPEPPGSD